MSSDEHFVELDGTTLTYERFRDVCLVPNRPAVIRNACNSGSDWCLPALQDALRPAALINAFGRSHQVPVYAVPNTRCAVGHADPANSARVDGCADDETHEGCETRDLGAVLDAWCKQWRRGEAAQTVWYLKDWHFQRDAERVRAASRSSLSPSPPPQRCSDGGLYSVPHFLGPDWMDPFCAAVAAQEATDDAPSMHGFGDGRSDYRFVYMGVPNSWTGLHHDVFGTYSWSLNVCGDKLWFFPTATGNRFLRENVVRGLPTPPDVRVLTGFELDAFVQHPGDLVFVPALFYHQVHNLTGTEWPVPTGCADAASDQVPASSSTVALTISLNHNWCNHFCVEQMMRLLMENARYLASMVSAADLEVVFDLVGRDACAEKLDEMLHAGSNWSLGAGSSFLRFCLDQLQQRSPVFCFDEHERAGAEALTEQLLADLTACGASLYT